MRRKIRRPACTASSCQARAMDFGRCFRHWKRDRWWLRPETFGHEMPGEWIKYRQSLHAL